jgi:hypothetical protein
LRKKSIYFGKYRKMLSFGQSAWSMRPRVRFVQGCGLPGLCSWSCLSTLCLPVEWTIQSVRVVSEPHITRVPHKACLHCTMAQRHLGRFYVLLTAVTLKLCVRGIIVNTVNRPRVTSTCRSLLSHHNCSCSSCCCCHRFLVTGCQVGI